MDGKNEKLTFKLMIQIIRPICCFLTPSQGRVECMGTYEELSTSGINFAELLKTNEKEGDLVDLPMSPVSDHGPPIFVNYSSQMSLVSATSDFEVPF